MANGITDSPMPNIATRRTKNLARIPVDPQQTSFEASGNASGVAAGNEFLLVFTNADGNVNSEFLFQLEWEEHFPQSYLNTLLP